MAAAEGSPWDAVASASLIAAGFKVVAEVKGASWSRTSRPRVDKSPKQDKFRWEKVDDAHWQTVEAQMKRDDQAEAEG